MYFCVNFIFTEEREDVFQICLLLNK